MKHSTPDRAAPANHHRRWKPTLPMWLTDPIEDVRTDGFRRAIAANRPGSRLRRAKFDLANEARLLEESRARSAETLRAVIDVAAYALGEESPYALRQEVERLRAELVKARGTVHAVSLVAGTYFPDAGPVDRPAGKEAVTLSMIEAMAAEGQR